MARTLAMAVAAVLACAGCGQKGALYLPDPQPQPVPASQPASGATPQAAPAPQADEPARKPAPK